MTIEQDFPISVLVVEDEVLIRIDVAGTIEDLGFRTYQAGTAEAAIALMQRHDDIQILFTDIDMPGSMDGLQLAAYIHERWPLVAIVVTSGAMSVAADAMPEGAVFLPKPYEMAALSKTLKNMASYLM
jgi:DNA-binding NtrC family response regulator